eukprot:g15038.t1
MTDPQRKRGRPKGSNSKASASGKAKQQHQLHHLSPSVQAQELLVGFDDKAATPRRAAVAAAAALSLSDRPTGNSKSSAAAPSTATGKRKAAKASDRPAAELSGAKRGRPRSIFPSPEKQRGGGGGGGGGGVSVSGSGSNGSRKKRKTSSSAAATTSGGVTAESDDPAERGNNGSSSGDGKEKPAGSGAVAKNRRREPSSKPGRPSETAAATTATKGGAKKANGKGGRSAAAASADVGKGANGGDAGSGEEEEEEEVEEALAASKKGPKKSESKQASGRKAGSRAPRAATPKSPSKGRARTVDTGGGVASSYPKRIRNAPDVFKAEPSSKPMSPAKAAKAATPARGGSSKAGEASSTKKGASAAPAAAAAAGAAAAKASASSKSKAKSATAAKKAAKSPATKKKPSKPAPPPPPPPPPPPYRFEYEGRPALGGRELISAAMFLYLSSPMMKFGRGFEVKMEALEDALSSTQPQESELLSLVHSRLLCTRRELKALKPGEMKYPYSWWTERLQKRLADWYRRRAILRELIFEADRSDDEGDVLPGGGVEDQRQQQLLLEEQQAAMAAGEAEALAGAGDGERGGPPVQEQQPEAGGAGADATCLNAEAAAAGAPGGPPVGQGAADAMDVEEPVAATATAATKAEPKPAAAGRNAETKANGGPAVVPEKSQEWSGGGVEESKGGEGPAACVKAPPAAVTGAQGPGVGTEGTAEISKRVSPTQCKVCNTRGTVMDMVKCIYEGCGSKYHLRCLEPPLEKVPKGQWYCPDCRAKKRVFGCNACMQNDKQSQILQCDGPKCGLEYHYGCLDPPLDKVPTTKWWYCPDCVRTDNQVGCRVCKNDVDYDKLLKCDGPGCELEWHMYCLVPPLKVVPKGDFFCPYCKAKQKVEFEKKRQQDIARANERRRRREARKATVAEPDSDHDDRELEYGTPGVAAMRRALLKRYEDLEPDSLRLELHRITILLRNIEETREASDALAAAAAASAATKAAAAAPAGGAKADAGAQALAASEKTEPEPRGRTPESTNAAAAADAKDVAGGGDGSGAAANTSPDEQEAANGAPGAETGTGSVSPNNGGASEEKAGSGAGGEKESLASAEVRHGIENKAAAAAAAAATNGGTSGGAGNGAGSGNAGGGGDGDGGGGGGGGDGDGGAAAAATSADPVAAFWAELAAAAPAESVVTEGSGDGEAEEEQEEREEEEELDGPWGGAGDSPLTKGRTYESLSPALRVAILSALCEEYLENEEFRLRVIDATTPEWLRMSPFGHDSSGRLYYRFEMFRKEMRVYRTVERDSPIPPVDKVATEVTGCGTLEAAAEAAANRKAPRLRGGSELELVSDSLEGLERLVAALAKSKAKNKKENDAVLHASLAEEAEEMRTWVTERMEREEKKRLADEAREKKQLALEAQPRRRSGRLARAEAEAQAQMQEEEEQQEEEEEGEEEEMQEQVQDQGYGDEQAADEAAQEPAPLLPGEAPPADNRGHIGEEASKTTANGDSSLLSPMDIGEDGDGDGDGGDAGEGQYALGASGSGVDGSRPLPEEGAQGPVGNGAVVGSPGEGDIAQEGSEQMGGEATAAQQAAPPGFAAVGPSAAQAPGGDAESGAAPPSLGKHPRSGDHEVGVDGFGGHANGGVAATAERGGVGELDDGSGGNASKRRRGEEGTIAIDAAASRTTAPPLVAASDLKMPAVEPEAAVTTTAAAAAVAAAADGPAAASGIVSANGANGNIMPPEDAPNGHGGADVPERPGMSVEGRSAGAVVSGSAGAVPMDVAETEKERVVDDGGHREPVRQGGGGATQPEERLNPVLHLQEKLPEKSREVGTTGGDCASPPAAAVPPGNGHPPSAAAAAAAAVSSPAGTPPPQEEASNRALDIMALAASSRPRVSTPPSSRSPSLDRSSGGDGSAANGAGGGDGGNNGRHQNMSSARDASSALDAVVTAVEAAPQGQAGGAGEEGYPAGASARSHTPGLP